MKEIWDDTIGLEGEAGRIRIFIVDDVVGKEQSNSAAAAAIANRVCTA